MLIQKYFLRKSFNEDKSNTPSWADCTKHTDITVQYRSYEGIEEFESRDDYVGKAYDWEGFTGYQFRTAPEIPNLETRYFSSKYSEYKAGLVLQEIDYNNRKSNLIYLNLNDRSVTTIQELDRVYFLTFVKREASLKVFGKDRLHKFELEIK